ncbi:MAG: outer membrane lipoprotein carrier protein LolA [Paludibacteraceae bacterium]|nr:outer membrane lipoprotein carrier protein LolA [Paludibacteraceae bacterium]
MKLLFVILTVLSSFLANLETKTLQSDFTVTVAEEVNAPMNYPGSIVMCGDKFRLEMFALEAAYDGKTLYMYSGETDELTLSNPTEQELVETNPLLYAKALVPVCNVVEKTITNNQSPITLITLTPKDQSIGISRFVLKVQTADLMPLSVEIKEGKKSSTLRFKSPRFITSKQEYKIIPDKDTYINDMRL